jgi:hypothetical protein
MDRVAGEKNVAWFPDLPNGRKQQCFMHRYYHYLLMEYGSALFVDSRMGKIERNIFPVLKFFIFFSLNSNFRLVGT